MDTSHIRIPPGHLRWQRDSYDIAVTMGEYGAAERIDGFTYKGLGLHPRWTVTHLNSGHIVCHLNCDDARAFTLATRIADMADWGFDGLNGWQNSDPDLFERFAMWMRANREAYRHGDNQHEGIARQIAVSRW